MPVRSAGIVLYRLRESVIEVLLVHPGGPFWAKKDRVAWSIPKGELGADEDAALAARREFEEELGVPPPHGEALGLGEIVQAGGKRVVAWAMAGDFDVASIHGNNFEMEWPPHSGKTMNFPEVDRAAWFSLDLANEKIVPGQRLLLERLRMSLSQDGRKLSR